jgi:hypothetical protein
MIGAKFVQAVGVTAADNKPWVVSFNSSRSRELYRTM